MKYGVVYRIICLETEKSYIGRTKNVLRYRWAQHCRATSNCLYLKHAIEKYGKDSFAITEIASAWDSDSLKELEALLIQQENTLAPNGYNLTNTGCGISEVSEETRKKLSQNISEGRKGILLSEEHKRSLSFAKKGRSSLMKGKKFSEEARKNMGLSNKGKTASQETKDKMSAVIKGMKWYTDGVQDCRLRADQPIPENFYLGRTKGLDNLTMLAELWKDPEYRRHMSEVHKKTGRGLVNTTSNV